MAIEKVIDIKVQGNVNEAVGSLRSQLRQAQQEVAALSEKFGATSAEAVNAAKRAGELKDRIGDAKALTDAFNPDAKFKALTSSLSGVAAGFSAYQGALNLAGVENKNLEESLLKVQSAMALSQGLQALGESRDSFKQLKAVAVDALKGIKAGIGATGIGLLVVALGTIAANWEDIVIAAKEAFPALNNVGNVFNKLKEYAFGAGNVIKNYILSPFKALGQLIAGDFKGAIEEIKKGFDVVGNYEAGAAKERQNQRDEAAAEQLAKLVKDNENRIAVLKASGKDTYALELENLKNKQKLYKDDQEKLDQALQDERILRAAHGKQLSDKEKADRLEREKLAKEEAERRNKLAQDLGRDAEQKYDDLLKIDKEAREKNLLALMTDQERETYIINKKYEQQIKDLQAAGISTVDTIIARDNEINDVNLKFQDLSYKQLEEFAEKEKALDIAVKDAKRAALDTGLNILMQFAGKNKALALSILAIQKGLAIADVVVGAAKGIAAAQVALASVPAFIGVVPNPAWAAQAAITAKSIALTKITAGTSIASILAAGIGQASSITSGGGGGGSTSPSGGGGAAGTTAPQFNVVGNTGVNQLAGVIGNKEAAPVQAYVVANNVTTAQSLDRNIIASATLGG
jgi:hypothetical protein